MADRPILFSAPMVRAILAGTKTQTRRAVKGIALDWLRPEGFTPAFVADPANGLCHYGQPGDRLWVREAWGRHPDFPESARRVCYRADRGHEYDGIRWRPSIHMPRWASRITLEVTGVRVERLQDISEADAIAEGIERTAAGHWLPGPCDHPEWAYHQLWDQINGPGSWNENPWVWVVEFKREGATNG